MAMNRVERYLWNRLGRYEKEKYILLDEIPYEEIDIEGLFSRSDICELLMYHKRAYEMLKYFKPSNFTELVKFFQVYSHDYLWNMVKFHTIGYKVNFESIDDIPYSELAIRCYLEKMGVPRDVMERLLGVYNKTIKIRCKVLNEDIKVLKEHNIPKWYIDIYLGRFNEISYESGKKIAIMFLKVIWIEQYMNVMFKEDLEIKKKVITVSQFDVLYDFVDNTSTSLRDFSKKMEYLDKYYTVIGMRVIINRIRNKIYYLKERIQGEED